LSEDEKKIEVALTEAIVQEKSRRVAERGNRETFSRALVFLTFFSKRKFYIVPQ